MRDWIGVIMAVLGVLLVLAGGTLLVLNALAVSGGLPRRAPAPEVAPAPDAATTEIPAVAPNAKPPVTARLTEAVRRLPSADRLIGWGVVLLVLAAIVAGAVTFNFQLAADN
jgi:hypothetical protein